MMLGVSQGTKTVVFKLDGKRWGGRNKNVLLEDWERLIVMKSLLGKTGEGLGNHEELFLK